MADKEVCDGEVKKVGHCKTFWILTEPCAKKFCWARPHARAHWPRVAAGSPCTECSACCALLPAFGWNWTVSLTSLPCQFPTESPVAENSSAPPAPDVPPCEGQVAAARGKGQARARGMVLRWAILKAVGPDRWHFAALNDAARFDVRPLPPRPHPRPRPRPRADAVRWAGV